MSSHGLHLFKTGSARTNGHTSHRRTSLIRLEAGVDGHQILQNLKNNDTDHDTGGEGGQTDGGGDVFERAESDDSRDDPVQWGWGSNSNAVSSSIRNAERRLSRPSSTNSDEVPHKLEHVETKESDIQATQSKMVEILASLKQAHPGAFAAALEHETIARTRSAVSPASPNNHERRCIP
ncbi:hypothetical protein T484DRAFT_2812613 [Baffinella frigidus]|nr:hypothetical protein T484DRAFT_2812613 [Cryptophyta sp. CCMP2293]